MRMSLLPASASSLLRSSTASNAYAVAAMNAILPPMASCLPIGSPHWTLCADHSRAILSDHFAAPAHKAGNERRPVLRVVNAILRPAPSLPIRFAAGTRTWWKRVTPFSKPRKPMNRLRFSTVIPGESASTTNALMPLSGTAAITTSSSATTPLVVHNFTPSRRYASPSSVGVAVVPSRAGSLPTSGSVNRNALIAPLAQRGRNSFFCSSVPKRASGCGTPMDWCADRRAPMAGLAEPASIRARL